ncbi:MAG: hypothetical protein JW724_03790 [Candidatus Altiarchaeota archaeon]|nr:hypothetical protein [Candidatus Altiarchaeota archaeon]
MDILINVYLTTRSDPVEDLDEIKELEALKAWDANMKLHAVKVLPDEKLDHELIDKLKGYTIKECYALVTHNPAKKEEPVHIGNFLKEFLKKNADQLKWELEETGASAISVKDVIRENPWIPPELLWDNYTYGVIADESLDPESYRVFLELVVKE